MATIHRRWAVNYFSDFIVKDKTMGKKIYVGNLSYNTTEDGLTKLFEQYGEIVSASINCDRITGRSRGFAFVEMANEDEALSAINALNGRDFDGRSIKVNEAYDKPQDRSKRPFQQYKRY
jgi:RNA recognition motif-containing protein